MNCLQCGIDRLSRYYCSCFHSLTHSHTHSLTHSPTHPLTHQLTNPPTHTLTHPFTHSPTHSFTHSLTHTHASCHSLILLKIYLYSHTPTHMFILPADCSMLIQSVILFSLICFHFYLLMISFINSLFHSQHYLIHCSFIYSPFIHSLSRFFSIHSLTHSLFPLTIHSLITFHSNDAVECKYGGVFASIVVFKCVYVSGVIYHCLYIYVYIWFKVRLKTEVLRTPSSTRPGFELMTFRS